MTELFPPEPKKTGWFSSFGPRLIAGIGVGVGSALLGWLLAAATRNESLALLPLCLAFIGALIITVRDKKFGLITGIIIGPVALIVGFLLLMLAICAGGSVGRWP